MIVGGGVVVVVRSDGVGGDVVVRRDGGGGFVGVVLFVFLFLVISPYQVSSLISI